jgi:ATP-dependent Clp protease ATP-binding subunit ClpC
MEKTFKINSIVEVISIESFNKDLINVGDTGIITDIVADTLIISFESGDQNLFIQDAEKFIKISAEKIQLNNENMTDKKITDVRASAELDDDNDQSISSKKNPKTGEKSKTPALDNFGRDLTRLAEEGKIDAIIGRSKEIERVAQILSRRKKNNVIVIGDPGVGKTAIAEGLALKIIQKQVSRALFDKRIVSLDLSLIVAGTKYRGQFEDRMKLILQELEANKDIIVFIDEIHTMIGAGGASGSLDAANIFKPALARGEIQCIGATTLDEYREHIEKDGALARRFGVVHVDPTTPEETLEILQSIKDKYEAHHKVNYTPEALEQCVKLAERYITDRQFPDKAIDILDETGARVHISNIKVPESIITIEAEIEVIKKEKIAVVKNQKYEEAAKLRDKEKKMIEELDKLRFDWEEETKNTRYNATEDDVAAVVSVMTGIPARKIGSTESVKLLNMPNDLKASVIGQDEAILKLAKSIRRNRVGLSDPTKPIGSFIFLGPTGVGKTETAKKLAEYLFDRDDALIRIDMSEYMEKFNVSKLVGAPPGYVGHNEGGHLTEKVRRKPYSVVLFDEIEKAHPDIFNTLLQVLDDGHLTDGAGRKVDFKNTVIIMTSNIGVRDLKDFGSGIGFATKNKTDGIEDAKKATIQSALKKAFSPEFLNRIDDVIIFNSLKREDIHRIIDITFSKLTKRVNALGYQIELTEKAKDFLSEKGYDEAYGARPLNRALQKYVEDILAEEILKGELIQGDKIFVNHEEGKDELSVSKQ